MPVNLLLCEGDANSPDARVLPKLLAGRCAILPIGGKYGMGDRIKARRDAMRGNMVYGLLDGDFVIDFRNPKDQPALWHGSDGTHFGWRWERKEIENYLIDPAVVQRSLGANAPPAAAYTTAVQEARDAIGVYQAARIALSVRRPRFSPLTNCFGPERGRLKHPFPDSLDHATCMDGIRQAVSNYQQHVAVSEDDVRAEFALRLPECQSGGSRFQDCLHAFAGKDLLLAMAPTLQRLGFASATVFLEKVLIAVDQTNDDLGDWLAEWRALQQLIVNT
jgi:hypothetical protein